MVDDAGHPLPDGQIGRLWIRGESAALMYWEDAARRQPPSRADLVMSGDLVERDADGYFQYRGRADDLLKVGGIWVAPAEIERCLGDAPRRRRVRGGRRGTRRADRGCGVGGPQAGGHRDARGVAATSSASVSRLTRSRARCVLVAELPRTGSGKIDRTALRRLAPGRRHRRQASDDPIPGIGRVHRALAALRLQRRRRRGDDHAGRPEKLGALTFDVYADLRDLLAELPHRGDARVVVITGKRPGILLGR